MRSSDWFSIFILQVDWKERLAVSCNFLQYFLLWHFGCVDYTMLSEGVLPEVLYGELYCRPSKNKLVVLRSKLCCCRVLSSQFATALRIFKDILWRRARA